MHFAAAVKAVHVATLVVSTYASAAWADEPQTGEPGTTPIATTVQPHTREPPGVVPSQAPLEPTAQDATGAPRPGDESGRIDQVDHGDSAARLAARAGLFLPKMVFEVASAPVRGSLWAYDRWQLGPRYEQVFFNDDHTLGLYPTATYQTSFGITVGAKFMAADVLGHHESVTAHVTYGGTYHTGNVIDLRTGDRFGSTVLGVTGNFDRRPDDTFYGIGNADEGSAPGTLIDPRSDDTAVQTKYRYQEARVAAFARIKLPGDFRAVIHGAYAQFKTSSSSIDTPIEDVYNPALVVGYMDTFSHLYGELELRWDTRRAASVWEPKNVHGVGTLVSVFAGGVANLDDAPDFWHYGGEIQHFIRLGTGPRVLALRFHGEGVTGSVDETPFVELPYLGGDTFLRGYHFQRFRDRVAAVASAQYLWDISHYVDAYLFVDTGRVYSAPDELTLSGLRMGYGLGLEAHTQNGKFLCEGSVASSIDGGVMFYLSFNPVFDTRARWR
jgi:hypothetical protein